MAYESVPTGERCSEVRLTCIWEALLASRLIGPGVASTRESRTRGASPTSNKTGRLIWREQFERARRWDAQFGAIRSKMSAVADCGVWRFRDGGMMRRTAREGSQIFKAWNRCGHALLC